MMFAPGSTLGALPRSPGVPFTYPVHVPQLLCASLLLACTGDLPMSAAESCHLQGHGAEVPGVQVPWGSP